ncbi:hypothetical protein BN2497_11207 [Janthinobacterium sp. CG23_2]|nr:hypothetical protein BN2497_11207 [Janthinobacterium sp. CG23_2]CUU32001.1 hypothetical protein BN3177_11207 [Janthinobacterium sp. CG23_2]
MSAAAPTLGACPAGKKICVVVNVRRLAHTDKMMMPTQESAPSAANLPWMR